LLVVVAWSSCKSNLKQYERDVYGERIVEWKARVFAWMERWNHNLQNQMQQLKWLSQVWENAIVVVHVSTTTEVRGVPFGVARTVPVGNGEPDFDVTSVCRSLTGTLKLHHRPHRVGDVISCVIPFLSNSPKDQTKSSFTVWKSSQYFSNDRPRTATLGG
jgi:hypothetical protein